ncbi:MAG: DUF721 domain-containing protein [Paramuribaculum sp.]|nr:DUF721 domain-containing protein [Paramuribaculum sp.]
MKRTEPKILADIINESLQQDGLDIAMAEQRALYVWPEIVGPGVNRYTTRRYVENGIMHVYLSSAVLKNELSYHRSSLVEQLNLAAGANVISQIVLH